MSVRRLVAMSMAVHLVLLALVFDIYFLSPVVQVSHTHGSGQGGLADRLVLIVGDGLRADTLFETHDEQHSLEFPDVVLPMLDMDIRKQDTKLLKSAAPYMRSLLESNQASWGLSHTRVPTESRPGHVALIAGMYEDITAVTSGWKNNPVVFDSAFNRSDQTYGFGAPDIVPMFGRGAPPGRVHVDSYDEDQEDFTKDAIYLDTWVYEQVHSLFQRAQSNATLKAQISAPRTIFFLHLLGLDTTGHSFRPHSPEYKRNLYVVDRIVEKTNNMFEQFFGPGQTAYIFTADHGMSDIGNHGDGNADCTRTPLIAWGRGVAKSGMTNKSHWRDEWVDPTREQRWNLDNNQRKDVEQADISALMSSILDIDFAGNNVGIVPTEYLDASDEYKTRSIFANAREVVEQFLEKQKRMRASRFLFKEFNQLRNLDAIQQNIEMLLDNSSFKEADAACRELLRHALDGIRYLYVYDRMFLLGILVMGYLGSMGYALAEAWDGKESDGNLPWAAVAAGVSVAARMAAESYHVRFLIYVGVISFLWHRVLRRREAVIQALSALGSAARLFGIIAALVGMATGFTYRSVWVIGCAILGVWPWNSGSKTASRLSLIAWRVGCLSMSALCLIPISVSEDLRLVAAGASLFIFSSLILFLYSGRPLVLLLSGTCSASLFCAITAAHQVRANAGLHQSLQAAGWALVLVPPLALIFYRHSAPPAPLSPHEWLIVLSLLSLAPYFIILSLAHEILFLYSFSLVMIAWVRLESVSGPSPWRRALFFMFFLNVAFFGTGNIASLASFHLGPVYRLVPVFAPFTMSALLIGKILVPYAILAAAQRGTGLSIPLYVALSDVISLVFAFCIKDEGSWLEVGQSVSHACIAGLSVILVAALVGMF